MNGGCTYILTNKNHSVLYIGVTADLQTRIREHKENLHPKCFTAKYNCNKLVWFECYSSIIEAINFEKYYKGKKRSYKIQLIESKNPQWKDLWEDVKEW